MECEVNKSVARTPRLTTRYAELVAHPPFLFLSPHSRPLLLAFGTYREGTAAMSNAPDRFALFILGEGEKRVEVQEETQIENAVSVILNKEDHTMGNMLRHAVLAVPGVLFCGYKVPHPLEPRTLLRIQTDGRLTPIQALRTGCERIIAQINQVRSSFQTEVSIRMPGGAGVGNLEDLNGAHGGGAGGYGYGAQGGDGYVDI
ncbi:RBP11-like subunits of RNA polymerase [Microstroma glucosiphilum]|uniref:RBP11-like subunits of RNA polymerase n=1 Tax=Pseudomicrostroma glucosiphilum TaxID=1684307 RepID=A0A316U854_9BASI|nr:RBP11-like subunits of RNA polymerase [Pseudomicrostroma glucosiphilum]PWN21332.1 RBP11-like subunits of RNA polymerase [Pseudomicrostroma glucosiphilum]